MCIVMKFKQSFFETLHKEWEKKQKEKLAMFLYTHLPNVSMYYTLHKITQNVSNYCETKIITKGQILL